MRIDGVIKSWQRRGSAMHKEVFMITAVVGANWGDEGKGKITDVLAQESDYIVRFQEVTLVTLSRMNLVNSGFTSCHQAFLTKRL